jgi:hypothetical protein
VGFVFHLPIMHLTFPDFSVTYTSVLRTYFYVHWLVIDFYLWMYLNKINRVFGLVTLCGERKTSKWSHCKRNVWEWHKLRVCVPHSHNTHTTLAQLVHASQRVWVWVWCHWLIPDNEGVGRGGQWHRGQQAKHAEATCNKCMWSALGIKTTKLPLTDKGRLCCRLCSPTQRHKACHKACLWMPKAALWALLLVQTTCICHMRPSHVYVIAPSVGEDGEAVTMGLAVK